MATYWLADNGNDANDGTSYAQAKATLSAAVALLSQGDTLNCVGSFDMLATNVSIDGNTLRGTSWNDPACIIQGTDSSGNPAFCNLTNNGFNREWLSCNNRPNYLIIRGFNIDTTSITDEGVFFEALGNHCPYRIEYCVAKGSPDAVGSRFLRLVNDSQNYSGSQEVDPAHAYVRYCYLDAAAVETNNHVFEIERCLFKYTGDASFPQIVYGDTNADRGPLFLVKYCSFDLYSTRNFPNFASIIQDDNNDNAVESTLRLHSNMFCVRTDNTPSFGGGFFNPGLINNGQSSSLTFSGTVGYNWFVLGSAAVSYLDGAGSTASAFYDSYYNPNYPPDPAINLDIHATDVRLDNTTTADLINATTTWTWADINGSGYSIDLPNDYRIANVTATTGSLDGTPVGFISELLNAAPEVNDWNSALSPQVVAVGDTFSVTAGAGLDTVCSDDDGDTLTYSVIDNVTHGSLTLNSDGSFSYTPNTTYSGPDSFTFEACDGTTCTSVIADSGGTNPSVFFSVSNQSPIITGDLSFTVNENQVLLVSAASGLLSNASDPEGLTLTATNASTPSNGTLTFNTTTGSFQYTPAAFFNGSDSFTYEVSDGANVATGTVNISVLDVVAPPVTEFIDTAPFFRPTLEVRTEFRFKTKKNRRKHHDLADYTEDVAWEESTHRIIDLGTNTTTEITLGGVASAAYVMVETDNPITVNGWAVDGCVAAIVDSISTLSLVNSSTVNDAQVILAVVD